MSDPDLTGADLTVAFAAAVSGLPGGAALWPAAVAVSGGGDSLALMLLLRDYAQGSGLAAPVVLTVDHALRPTSRAEALQTARWAKAAGLTCHILTRKGPPPAADIEAAARQARYQLMGDWALRHHVATVFLAHTLDDQAETFLIRLLRGSGVDGLSAMRPVSAFPFAGYERLRLARPLLRLTRADLRAFLTARGQNWHDDPMNEDDRFTRVKLRQAWPVLEELGFQRARLADAADHLARARDALESATDALEATAVQALADRLLLDPAVLAAAPAELGLRLLARLLMQVSGQTYRPRFERLERLYQAILRGDVRTGRTLHGCKIAPAPRRLSKTGMNFLQICVEPAIRRDGQHLKKIVKKQTIIPRL